MAYCAVALTEDAVKAAFTAQMEALAADPDRALSRARLIPDATGLGPDALLLPSWRVPKQRGD